MGGASASERICFPTVTAAFLNQVAKRGNTLAVHTKVGTEYKGLTWKQLHEEMRLISLGLQQLGVKKEDKVCIVSNTRLEWLECDMAILGRRAITVPIYASNTAEDSAYIFNHSEAHVVFVEDDKQLEKFLSMRDKLTGLSKIVVFAPTNARKLADEKDVITLAALKELGKRSKKDDFDDNLQAAQPQDVFTICYTSGTTGVPKGVVLTHDSLASILEDIERSFGKHVGENDITLTFLPFSHIFGKIEAMASYLFGWQTY